MTRDIHRGRALLLEAERSQAPVVVESADDVLQVRLLEEAGFVVVGEKSSMTVTRLVIKQITWKGYEFLDAVRDDNVWQLATQAIVPLEMVYQLARRILVERIGTQEAVMK